MFIWCHLDMVCSFLCSYFKRKKQHVKINNVRISKYVQQDFVKAQTCMMKYFGAKVTKSWTKKNLWMTAFKNFEGAQSA